MNKIEIETYKGQTIFYDEDDDKFVCSISVEDKSKTTKRQSLKGVRQEIDAFIKANLEFKPFTAFIKSQWDSEGFTMKFVTGIRTDGALITKNEKDDTRFDLLQPKEFSRVYIFDPAVAAEIKRLDDDREAAYKKYTSAKKKEFAKLQPADLSRYMNETATTKS